MEHEAVGGSGNSRSLTEISIASGRDLSKAESCQNFLPNPQTPRKTPCLGLDYSTPRLRYGGKYALPLTPEYTPSKRSKRTYEYTPGDVSCFSHEAKRRHTHSQTLSRRPLVWQGSMLNFSLRRRTEMSNQAPFSADEMKRTCEAVLSQVDWNEVQEYVASNRSAASYRKAMKAVLQAEVDRIFDEEDKSDKGSTD